MDAHKDIRILTLQKQHYFNNYTNEMPCDYSCWGYYDGVTINDTPVTKTELFQKRSDAPISQMWYGSGRSIEGLDGRHSRQNISIFRDYETASEKKKTEEFWKTYNTNPYMAIGFLKIGNAKEYREAALKIEAKESATDQGTYVKILVYNTLDNADLIFIALSNSLHKLEYTLKEIDMDSDIKYIHSILGVNENWLKHFSSSLCAARNGSFCILNEQIEMLILRVAVSGNEDTLEKLSWQIRTKTGISDVSYMYGLGHHSAVLIIRKLTEKDLLSLYVGGKNSVLTHSNPLFGTEIYNIETELHITEKQLNMYSNTTLCIPAKTDTDASQHKRFGELLIEKYKAQMESAFKRHDESMYSYCKALIQTTNTLTQYEGFPMAKDIFYLLFPAMDMFDRHLDYALPRADAVNIKESVCEFINSVNSIIYHTVHTDQVFLMIPGYSGTSFSIPVKLCLMYLWLAGEIIEFLNDRGYEYTCFITPKMESKPITTLINMDMNRSDRLICFFSSQRSLYMPRHFMTILTHEIAHYVGTKVRMRKVRTACIIKTLAYFLAEGVFQEKHLLSEDLSETEKILLKKIYKENKPDAQTRAMQFLRIKIAAPNCEYHATEIKRPLEEGCLEFLSDGCDSICSEIFRIPLEIIDINLGCTPAEKAKMLYKVQMKLNASRTSLQTSGVMERIISELISVYREVFSDLAAISILQCDKDTFTESYDVSEGTKDTRSVQQTVRDYIADMLFWKKDSDINEQPQTGPVTQRPRKNNSVNFDPDKKDSITQLYDNMYSYIWVRSELMEYARSCYTELMKRLENANQNRLESVREFFGLFSQCGQGEDAVPKTCSEIYDEMMKRIELYKEHTEEKYKNWLENN